VSVTFLVDGLGGGGVDGGVEGGVEGGGSEGGVMTTVVGGCSKLAIAVFCSKFIADREPLDEGTEPLPAEATGRTPAALANGETVEDLGAAVATPVEVTPGRGVAVDFVTDAVAVGIVPLLISTVVCVTCPAATPDATAARGVWDEVAGAVIEAMAGRLANVRGCVNGMVGRETDALGGPIRLVMRVGSALGGWSIVP
jgi:hypothetical protein